ncbi:hypothetical protein [Rosistilla ulvae]|nr:hypothetical protein [Rosistilla ulvae]
MFDVPGGITEQIEMRPVVFGALKPSATFCDPCGNVGRNATAVSADAFSIGAASSVKLDLAFLRLD